MRLRYPLLLTLVSGAAVAFKVTMIPVALGAALWTGIAMIRRLAPRRATTGTGVPALITGLLIAALTLLTAGLSGQIVHGLAGFGPPVADAQRRLMLQLPDIGLVAWLALALLPAIRQLYVRRGLAPEPPPQQWQALGGLVATLPVRAAIAQVAPYLDVGPSASSFNPRIGTLGLWPAAALFVASGMLLWWSALRAGPREPFNCPGLYGRTLDAAIVAWGIVAGLCLIDTLDSPRLLDNPAPVVSALELVAIAAMWIWVLAGQRRQDPPGLAPVALVFVILAAVFVFSVTVPAVVVDSGTGPLGGLGALVASLGTLPFLAATLAFIWYFVPRLLARLLPAAPASAASAA